MARVPSLILQLSASCWLGAIAAPLVAATENSVSNTDLPEGASVEADGSHMEDSFMKRFDIYSSLAENIMQKVPVPIVHSL